MTETGAMPSLLDLADELRVASTLLAVLATPEANTTLLLQMCAASVGRCQKVTETPVKLERRNR